MAGTVGHSIRATDHLGRWGGEEFVVTLLNVAAAQLRILAEKLRMLIERSTTPWAGGKVKVTISLGATLTTPPDTLETLVKRADTLLYASKQGGRNRVSTDCAEA